MAASVLLMVVVLNPGHAQGRQGMFGLGNRFELDELPEGRLRNQLDTLPESARHKALEWMHRFSFPAEDVASLHVDREGGVFYVCEFPSVSGETRVLSETDPEISGATLPVSPFPDSLKFHSRPGAPNVIYLNFVGSNITGTAWNDYVGRSVIPARVFSTDTDYTTFSDAEQAIIKRVWQRVAEDYAPFDVNVTTEKPDVWNNRTAHVLITRNTDENGDANPYSNAGGVAYVDVFGLSNYGYYRPAWVYHNNLSNRDDYIAEAASHEAGHNLGLSHDGQSGGVEYYGGHGSGNTSWGPIMGTGYGRHVSQWCKGDYYLANNTQDDLAIIAGKMGYRPDDHGDAFATASYLSITSNTLVLATTPETDPANQQPGNKGLLIGTADVDMWAFSSGDGQVNLTVRPWISAVNTRGGNLDVRVTLYDAGGHVVVQNDPTNDTYAAVQAMVPSGVYYLKVEGVGTGDPFSTTPHGYAEYGSLGQYFITGMVADVDAVAIPPQAVLSASNVVAGATSHTFQIIFSDDVAINVSSLGDDDARVTGPAGYNEAAQLIAVDDPTDGTPRTGTYQIPAPGGAWDVADNGVYAIWMNSNAVMDVEGVYVAAGSLGSFTSVVPSVIYAAYMDADPGWTLEPLWAYGQPGGSGGMPSSGATGTNVIGYNLDGNYENNLSLKHATTPAIDCSGTDVVILRFQRWLGLGQSDTATVQVSSNGTSWTTIWSASSSMTDSSWQWVQYDVSAWVARSPTVYVRWAMGSSPPPQASFGWNLDDVEILGVSDPVEGPPTYGAIECTLGPLQALEQGAQWRLAEGEWLNSGDRVDDLEPGEYVIQFNELLGWISPEEQVANVVGDETNVLSAAYEALMTTNQPTPIWWLIENGITEDFEDAVLQTGANGFALWASYVAGLDPNDSTSIFRVDVVAPTVDQNGLILVWNAVSGRTYSVYWMPELGAELMPVPGAQDMPWPQDTYVFPIDEEMLSGALRFKVRFPGD